MKGPDEIITLAGMRRLRLDQRKGRPLPKNWETLVRNYLETKSHMVALHKLRHDKIYRGAEEHLAEATRIAKLMGVKYGR